MLDNWKEMPIEQCLYPSSHFCDQSSCFMRLELHRDGQTPHSLSER